MIDRRAFISCLGSTAAATPLSTRAQQTIRLPVVGLLSSVSSSSFPRGLIGLRRGLAENGYVEGTSLQIDYRWADNEYGRLPEFADDLVQRGVSVIIAAGGTVSAHAAKARTSTIPVVFTGVSDPVEAGLVKSFSQPGGNVTGISILGIELDAKRLDLLSTTVPGTGAIGALVNPNRPERNVQIEQLRAAAAANGRPLVIAWAGGAAQLSAAFAILKESNVEILVVGADPLMASLSKAIVALAAEYALPGIYQWRESAEIGGLISYGPSLEDSYYQAGLYAGRILRGAKPSELPVVQSARIELVVNLKTAKTLGLTIPSTILLRADEVIE